MFLLISKYLDAFISKCLNRRGFDYEVLLVLAFQYFGNVRVETHRTFYVAHKDIVEISLLLTKPAID